MGLFLLSFMAELLKASVIALFLISLVLLSRRVEASAQSDDAVCETGQYMNQTGCAECTVCPEGYGVQELCQRDSTDTVCTQCNSGQYSKLTPTNRFCTECSNCTALSRQLLSVCTVEEDAVCGSCQQDHFLQISRDGSTQCVECSQCPPDSSAVRWFECSHLPMEQQCAPGYTTLPAVTEVVHTAHSVADLLPQLARLTRNRTVYFAVGPSAVRVKKEPIFESIVSAVSLLFTLITVIVFMSVSMSACKKCCKLHCHHRVRRH